MPCDCDPYSPTVTARTAKDQRFPVLCGPSADQGDHDLGLAPVPPCAGVCGAPVLRD
jgi:hypothetical protein